MSFLDKIWDETLAGPAPDSGLGKLRKYNSFSAVGSQSQSPASSPISIPTLSRTFSGNPNSFPDSPIGSTTPPALNQSPETPRGEDMKRFMRRRSADYPARRRPLEAPQRNSPTVYDWIVITALDR